MMKPVTNMVDPDVIGVNFVVVDVGVILTVCKVFIISLKIC